MKKRHALAISLLVGLAVVAGAFAAVKSVQAGPSQSMPSVPQTSIADQQAPLDSYEARLDAAIVEARARAQSTAAATSLSPQSDAAYAYAGDDRGGDDLEAE